MSPQLQDLSDALNQAGHPRARHAFAFDAARCMAPLPRACQRVGGWPGVWKHWPGAACGARQRQTCVAEPLPVDAPGRQ